MKDLSYISQEINKGHNLSMNLEKYATGMSAMYQGLAYIKFSMNYYTVFDMLREKSGSRPELEAMMKDLHEIVASSVLKQEQTEITRIDSLRNEIISVMETITSYVDRLRIYEYVLNRVEHHFSGQELDEEYYGMYLTNDLMHYIFSEKDNVVINSKISEIVAQLPMRLSKPKFYEYIQEAFTLYHGAQKGTIDDFVYTLKTSAMINEIDESDERFPDVRDICKTLANADYKNISNEEYQRLKGALTIGAEQMSDFADLYVLMAQLVNDVYTIILTGKNEIGEVEEIAHAKKIIAAVNQGIESDGKEFNEDILEEFAAFEGKQERILSVVTRCDSSVDIAKSNYQKDIEDAGLTSVYNSLSDIMKLQSGSDFVNLSVSEDKEIVPENSYADQAVNNLIKELDQSFEHQGIMVRRAVMSAVLSQLPVFFNNADEIQQYINLSLELCNDEAEQKAVVEVCKMIVQENI